MIGKKNREGGLQTFFLNFYVAEQRRYCLKCKIANSKRQSLKVYRSEILLLLHCINEIAVFYSTQCTFYNKT